MKRYIKYFVLLLIGVLALASCSKKGNNPTTTSEVVTEYNIRFLQDDNSTVIKEMKVKAGEKITYTGDTPTKASDNDYNYTFKEWNPALATATKDQDFVAVYDKTAKQSYVTNGYTVNLVFDETKGNVTASTTLTDIASGTKVVFTVSPKENYKYDSVKLNDQTANVALVDSKFELVVYSNLKIEVLFAEGTNPDNPSGGNTDVKDAVDVLNHTTVNGDGTNTYRDWNEVTLASGAKYQGNSAFEGETIQLRSRNDNSGIVVSNSIGKVTKVEITFNSKTNAERVVEIYGSKDKFSVSDMYQKRFVIGEISLTKTTLVINKPVEYIGIRSKQGAVYIDEIKIYWGEGTGTDTPDTPNPDNPGTDTPDTPSTEEVVSFDVDTYCVNNKISKGDKVTTIKSGIITMTVKGGANTGKMYPKDNYNNVATWRIYGSSRDAGSITITSSTKDIESIIIYCLDSDNAEGQILAEDGTVYASGDEIEVNGKSITLYGDTNQSRIYKIEFIYEGTDATEYSIEEAIKNYAEDNNYKVIFKMSGTGDLAGDSYYNYQLTELYDNGKIKVVEKYSYQGESYEDINYFYYDKDGVFHMIYLDTESGEDDWGDYDWDDIDWDSIDWDNYELKKNRMNAEDDTEGTYIDIAETNAEYQTVASYYTYFTNYDFKAITADALEKVSTNTYKVKADSLKSVSEAIFGELSYSGDENDNGYAYTFEVTEDITEILIKIKEDRFQSITVKSNYTYIMDYEDPDDNGETHYEYNGTLTYSFKFSEFGKQKVTLPEATKYVVKVTLPEVFSLEDGTEVSFDELYVNGVNTLENLVFVCDEEGSIAVSIKDLTLTEMPKVGSIVSLEGKVVITGKLVIIEATSMNVDNNDPGEMVNYDVNTLSDRDETFAGESVNFNYLTIKTKDIDNLNIIFEELDGTEIKLSFIEAEKENVTELFKQIDVNSTILLKNVSIMLDGDDFVIVLMDHASYEVVDGLAIKSNSITVESGTSLDDATAGVVLYSFDNGLRTEVAHENITFSSTEYNGDKAGTYLVTITYNEKTISFYVTVKLGKNVDAFVETAGKGIAYAADRYNLPYGLASTTPEGEEALEVLVIPVSFTNQTVPTGYKELLEKGFNGTAEDTGWESFSSYYYKSSYGKLKFHANIMDIYETGDPYSKTQKTINGKSYPEDYLDGYQAIDYKYLDKAIAAYDELIDYNKYDSNKDGYIDCVYLVYLAPYSTGQNDLDYWWAYNNKTYGTIESTYDGLGLDTYMWFSYQFFEEKIEGHDEVKINAETVIHESGHALGLDDYYDTSYSNNGGFGSGAMMDANVGDHDPYSKALLGWITPTIVIDKDATIELSSFEKSGDAIFIAKDYNGIYFNEYYIIDYYTPTGLNELQKGEFGLSSIEGIRIIHVNAVPKENESQIISIWDVTAANNSNSENKLIYVVEADGNNSISKGNEMSDSDLWQVNDVASEFKWADGTECNFMIEVSKIENGKATISIVFVDQD